MGSVQFVVTWIPDAKRHPARYRKLRKIVRAILTENINELFIAPPDNGREGAIEEMLGHIDAWRDLPDDGHDDLNCIYEPGMPYVLLAAGGSWYSSSGDPPSEHYSTLEAIRAIPEVMKQLKRWATDDAREFPDHDDGKVHLVLVERGGIPDIGVVSRSKAVAERRYRELAVDEDTRPTKDTRPGDIIRGLDGRRYAAAGEDFTFILEEHQLK